MKKIISTILALTLCAGFCGCESSKSSSSIIDPKEKMIQDSTSQINDEIKSLSLKYDTADDLKTSKADLETFRTHLFSSMASAAGGDINYAELMEKLTALMEGMSNVVDAKESVINDSPSEQDLADFREYLDAYEEILPVIKDLIDNTGKKINN